MTSLVDIFDRSRLHFNQSWNYIRHTVKNFEPCKQWIFQLIVEDWERQADAITQFRHVDKFGPDCIVDVIDFVDRQANALICWGIIPINDETIALSYSRGAVDRTCEIEYTLQDIFNIVQNTQLTVCTIGYNIGDQP
jgi:hypothetical protein